MKTSFTLKRLLLLLGLPLPLLLPGGGKGAFTAGAQDYSPLYRDLSIEIAMPELPVIPERRVSVLDFGAKGDGLSDNAASFKKAVKALAKQGGGHLDVPAGVYLTSPFSLSSHIDLHLEKGAVIQLSPDKKDHLEKGKVVPGIRASKQTDISITGEGTIDGNGQLWRAVKRVKVSDTEWAAFRRMGGTVSEDGSLWYPFNLNGFDNIADVAEAQEKLRTHLVRFTDCERVLVSGVTIQNSPKFHLVPQRCTDVTFDGVRVRCPWNAQNGDGIDPMQCRRVLITGCIVDVGDDGICLKGGVGSEGVKNGPCEDFLIVGNTVYRAHGGFVIGSEFSGGINRIVVKDNFFSGTDTGLRFKSAVGRGGRTSNVFITGTRMTDIGGEAIIFETTYLDRPAGSPEEGIWKDIEEQFVPDFTDIHISDLVCRGCRTGILVKGTAQTVHGIEVKDGTILYFGKGSDIPEGEAMVKMENVVFRPISGK